MKTKNNNRTIAFENTCGLVVCGGKSSRMGTDKSLLQYYEKPQRYYVYDLLNTLCEEVNISCNAYQVPSIEAGYSFLTDKIEYENMGPVAALLSAFTKFPGKHILLIGCDYPFLGNEELVNFSTFCTADRPVSFYNEEANCYEPMLAWYPFQYADTVKQMIVAEDYSLQHFLHKNKAVKYFPKEKNCITSVDTHEDFAKALKLIKS